MTALFRHPLGLPIPHTAIIPRNKDRIGDQLAQFLREISSSAGGRAADGADRRGRRHGVGSPTRRDWPAAARGDWRAAPRASRSRCCRRSIRSGSAAWSVA
ncbi:DUF445 family protein [Sphingomonas sp. MMS24-JH45]